MRLGSICPDDARRQEANPGFCEFAVDDPIDLHTGLGLLLTLFVSVHLNAKRNQARSPENE